MLDNASSFGGDPKRVAVAGESAGGNMAAAIALRAREQKVALPVHQLLVYPVASFASDTPSYNDSANAKPLNAKMMSWFFGHYLRSQADARSPWVHLVGAPDLAGLPPATVITAQIDPLRSEGQAYAERLRAAGVAVEYRNFEGVTHEFFGMGAVVDEAKAAVAFAAKGLKGGFAR